MESIFVTGTDTDAGKTVAAAALLAVVRDDGIDAVHERMPIAHTLQFAPLETADHLRLRPILFKH